MRYHHTPTNEQIKINRFHRDRADPRHLTVYNYSVKETILAFTYFILFIWALLIINAIACTRQIITPKILLGIILCPLQSAGDYNVYESTNHESYWSELAY